MSQCRYYMTSLVVAHYFPMLDTHWRSFSLMWRFSSNV